MSKFPLSVLKFVILFPFLSCAQSESVPAINEINASLKSKKLTVSEVLSNPKFMHFHSETKFREVIKQNASTDTIKIVTETELGVHILVKGIIKNQNGEPMVNSLLYFYHTSTAGWYSDKSVHISGPGGDHGHARLFGYLRTNTKGEFFIKTIRPNGYPDSDLPAHIHLQLWDESGRNRVIPGELLFADDPRFTPLRRERAIADGFLISANTGTSSKPVYIYALVAQ
jgi:protocatechuate 3,4-dioxygenase beta subunit